MTDNRQGFESDFSEVIEDAKSLGLTMETVIAILQWKAVCQLKDETSRLADGIADLVDIEKARARMLSETLGLTGEKT